MKLILVRHGETESNNEDLLQGQQDGKLSPRGLRQAEALRNALKGERIDAVYSSDLSRGSVTAGIVASPHGLPVTAVQEARERCFGIYEGTNRTAYYARERAMADPCRHQPETGESFVQLYERAKDFITRLYERHAQQTVLLVSHGDFARMCLGVLLNRSVEEACRISQKNSCINVLEVTLTPSGFRSDAIALNRVDHLPPELISRNASEL